jgi:hypothetical protein
MVRGRRRRSPAGQQQGRRQVGRQLLAHRHARRME